MADENGVVYLYTTEPCGFCRQAKTLLQARGVDYREVNLAKDPVGRAELVALTGQMTFPQIVVGTALDRRLPRAARSGPRGHAREPAGGVGLSGVGLRKTALKGGLRCGLVDFAT